MAILPGSFLDAGESAAYDVKFTLYKEEEPVDVVGSFWAPPPSAPKGRAGGTIPFIQGWFCIRVLPGKRPAHRTPRP